MHDPMTVAFDIRSPWPKPAPWYTGYATHTATRWKASGAFWILAPAARDHVTCRTKHWRLHVHHWRIQIPPLQALRRRLFTRCAWCNGPHRKGDAVNISHQWNRPRGHWWQGETGLFHRDCSAIQSAHSTCVCTDPVLDEVTYGRCARCTKHRSYGTTPQRLARARELAAIPTGHRAPTNGELP